MSNRSPWQFCQSISSHYKLGTAQKISGLGMLKILGICRKLHYIPHSLRNVVILFPSCLCLFSQSWLSSNILKKFFLLCIPLDMKISTFINTGTNSVSGYLPWFLHFKGIDLQNIPDSLAYDAISVQMYALLHLIQRQGSKKIRLVHGG